MDKWHLSQRKGRPLRLFFQTATSATAAKKAMLEYWNAGSLEYWNLGIF